MTESQATAVNSQEKKHKFHETWAFLIVFCIVLPIVFRTFAWSPFHIPSGSMKPTLLIGDYIFVSKFTAGYSRYSLPFGAPLIKGRIFEKPLKRGDIVVFRRPHDENAGFWESLFWPDFIKRLVGLPGDEIQMKDGVLFINGHEVKKHCDAEFFDEEKGKKVTECTETLPEGLKYEVLDELPNGPLDNTGIYKVPPGHYFFMGDNRDNSQDSRVLAAVGYVPEENIIGRADLIFFSARYSIFQPWNWLHMLRGDRFFKTL